MVAVGRASVLGLAVLLAAVAAAADTPVPAVGTGTLSAGPDAASVNLLPRTACTFGSNSAARTRLEPSWRKPNNEPGGGCGEPMSPVSESDWDVAVAIGGIGGGVVGFVGGMLAGRSLVPGSGWGEAVASGVGATFGAAGGAWALGRACQENGQWWPTLLGASIGTLVAVPLFWHEEARGWDDERMKPVWYATLVLPGGGAMAGFYLSRPRCGSGNRFLNRLGLPSIALRTSALLPKSPALDARFLSIGL